MGGREAARGFLYQGFASVLEALTDESGWDKIYVELQTMNDKVDIALEKQGRLVKCIQVKSSINGFTRSDIEKWIQDLVNDKISSGHKIDCPVYELFLIGYCEKTANIFIKSVEKYYGDVLDTEVKTSLNSFETDLLDHKQIRFIKLPYNLEILKKIIRDSLHHYISYSDQMMTYDQISFIAAAMVNDQMMSSINGDGIGRKEFEEKLKKRLLLIADQNPAKRISIGVQSYTHGAGNLEGAERCLSLIDMFDGRDIKAGYDWNNDIYKKLEFFLTANMKANRGSGNEYLYQIFLNTHTSIAFAAGRILDSKSGINVFPTQKSSTGGIVLWDVDMPSKKEYADWDISYERLYKDPYDDQNDPNSKDLAPIDTALVLNVTHTIYKDVEAFIKENRPSIGLVINCALRGIDATNYSIEDGTHAATLASSVYSAVQKRSKEERRAVLHIFASAPNAFMFFLGQNSGGFGKCILYEYDFEQRGSGTYSPSICFLD